MSIEYVREMEEFLGLPHEDDEDVGLHYMIWLDNMYHNKFPKESELNEG